LTPITSRRAPYSSMSSNTASLLISRGRLEPYGSLTATAAGAPGLAAPDG
jgi:hypothetical protein